MEKDCFARALADFTAGQPAHRVLLAPSRRVGQRLLAQAARAGVPVAGVTAHSLFTLAVELCTDLLNGPRPRQLLTRLQTEQLVQRLLWEHREDAAFAGGFWQGGAAARAVWQQLEQTQLACAVLPAQEGLRTLAALLDQSLQDNAQLTRPLLFRLALEQCRAGALSLPARAFARVDCVRLTPLEQALWEAITGGQETVLPLPGGTVEELAAALQPRCRFVACRGTENEARWILQDLVHTGKAPDSAAVAVSSPAMALQLWQEGRRLGLEVAVDGGIPLSGFPLPALLRGLDRWRQQDYGAELFRDLLAFPALSSLRRDLLARQLRRRQVVSGRDRYARLWTDTGLSGVVPSLWKSFFDLVFAALTPGPGQRQALGDFLTEYGRPVDGESAAVLAQLDPPPGQDLLPPLLEALEGSRCLSSGPRPGALFCAGYAQCLGCGAEVLYVTGLSAAELLTQPAPLPFGGQPALPRESLTDQLQRLLFSATGRVVLLRPSYTVENLLEQSPALLYTRLRDGCGAEEESFGFADWEHPAPAPAGQEVSLPAPAVPPLRNWLEGTVLSATALETALHCPYQFMLQYVLGIFPDQPFPMPRTRWLESNALGTLVHGVLQACFDPTADPAPDPGALLDRQLEELERSYPPATPDLMEKDKEKARALVEAGLKTLPAGSKVLATEQSFGKDAPLTVRVGRYTLSIQGSIDRLDLDPDGGWTVVDYKTGRISDYRDHPDHHLQPLLYALAAEALHHRPGAVRRARYLGLDEDITVELSLAGADRTLALQKLEGLLDYLCGSVSAPACNPCLTWQQDHWQPWDEATRPPCATSRFCPFRSFCPANEKGGKNDS